MSSPLVVAFEDLHWADETLLELLRFLVDGDDPGALLILGTARPELRERSPAILVEGEDRHVVELEPLTRSESEALLGGPRQDIRMEGKFPWGMSTYRNRTGDDGRLTPRKHP